jgi:hypothetical protein
MAKDKNRIRKNAKGNEQMKILGTDGRELPMPVLPPKLFWEGATLGMGTPLYKLRIIKRGWFGKVTQLVESEWLMIYDGPDSLMMNAEIMILQLPEKYEMSLNMLPDDPNGLDKAQQEL